MSTVASAMSSETRYESTAPPAGATPRRRRMFLKLTVLTGIVYVVWLTAGCALQRKVIYPRGMVQASRTIWWIARR